MPEFQKVTAPSGSGLAWIVNMPAVTLPADPYGGTRSFPATQKVVCSGSSSQRSDEIRYENPWRAGIAYVFRASAPELTDLSCPAGFHTIGNPINYANVSGRRYECTNYGYAYIMNNSVNPSDVGFVSDRNSYNPVSDFNSYYSLNNYLYTGSSSYSGGAATFETQLLCYR